MTGRLLVYLWYGGMLMLAVRETVGAGDVVNGTDFNETDAVIGTGVDNGTRAESGVDPACGHLNNCKRCHENSCKDCKDGYWGFTCNHQCRGHCKSGRCGLMSHCYKCETGWYGFSCHKRCDHCEGACDYYYGSCPTGCIPGKCGPGCWRTCYKERDDKDNDDNYSSSSNNNNNDNNYYEDDSLSGDKIFGICGAIFCFCMIPCVCLAKYRRAQPKAPKPEQEPVLSVPTPDLRFPRLDDVHSPLFDQIFDKRHNFRFPSIHNDPCFPTTSYAPPPTHEHETPICTTRSNDLPYTEPESESHEAVVYPSPAATSDATSTSTVPTRPLTPPPSYHDLFSSGSPNTNPV